MNEGLIPPHRIPGGGGWGGLAFQPPGHRRPGAAAANVDDYIENGQYLQQIRA